MTFTTAEERASSYVDLELGTTTSCTKYAGLTFKELTHIYSLPHTFQANLASFHFHSSRRNSTPFITGRPMHALIAAHIELSIELSPTLTYVPQSLSEASK